tara:strand:+ start:9129 stop:9869 length:741 start_codon:yes stop_codon:yes gene_type:complete
MVNLLFSDLSTNLTIFLVISLIAFTLIRIVIHALLVDYFIKKEAVEMGLKKAFISVLIPIITLIIVSLPALLWEYPYYITLLVNLLYFPILYLSISKTYQVDRSIVLKVTLKFFAVMAIIWLIGFGLDRGSDALNESSISFQERLLNSNTVNTICNSKCEFAYSLNPLSNGSLIVIGYNIPKGEYKEKENYRINEKIFLEEEIKSMKTGAIDSNGNSRIRGMLESESCTYMNFLRESGRSTGISCN